MQVVKFLLEINGIYWITFSGPDFPAENQQGRTLPEPFWALQAMADGLDTSAWMGTSNIVTAEFLDTSKSTFFLWFQPQQNDWCRWPGIHWVCRVSRVHSAHQKSVLYEKLPPAYPRWWAVRAPHTFFSQCYSTYPIVHILIPQMEFNALLGRTFGPSAVNALWTFDYLLPALTFKTHREFCFPLRSTLDNKLWKVFQKPWNTW